MDAKARLADICRSHAIEILYAFGSRAAQALSVLEGSGDGFSTSDADLDIGVKPTLDRHADVREKVKIAVELEELFAVPRVDLVLLSEADPFLAANIIRGERLFSADAISADEYELYILRRAGDLAPLERERLDLLQGR